MFIKSGLTDDQINHIYGFVYDPEAEGPLATLDPRKIQEAVLRFYDKPWDVDRHRDSRASMGRYSRPLMGHAATTHRHQTSCSATLAVRNHDESFRGKGKDSKAPPTRARAKEERVGKVAKTREVKARVVVRVTSKAMEIL